MSSNPVDFYMAVNVDNLQKFSPVYNLGCDYTCQRVAQ